VKGFWRKGSPSSVSCVAGCRSSITVSASSHSHSSRHCLLAVPAPLEPGISSNARPSRSHALTPSLQRASNPLVYVYVSRYYSYNAEALCVHGSPTCMWNECISHALALNPRGIYIPFTTRHPVRLSPVDSLVPTSSFAHRRRVSIARPFSDHSDWDSDWTATILSAGVTLRLHAWAWTSLREILHLRPLWHAALACGGVELVIGGGFIHYLAGVH
jgi:hypothetical protein